MIREPQLADIEEFESLHRASRFLDVHARLAAFSPPETWSSCRARVIAGRTMGNLGGMARSRRLHLTTWRRHPEDAEARYFMVLDYHERHGPVETLRLFDRLALPDSPAALGEKPPARGEAWLWLVRARCLAQCRDFEAAEPWLAAALAAEPNEPWTHVEHSMCLEQADRYTEALAAAEHALAIRPGYARAVWHVAHLLTLANRDDDAIALLRREVPASQSAHGALSLGGLLREREEFAGAQAAFELAEQRFLFIEKPLAEFLRSRRAEMLYRLGRDTEAAELARGVSGRYWENFAARAAAPANGAPPRVQLAVPFVRQHHMTCAPATMSAVSTFLKAPIDHLELARVIAYDGTPDHEERHWLESHGWRVREFRVTWDAALALLARGLPFTLVTTWTGSAHLQAVVGCDPRLGTFVIRDPYFRETHETLAAELLEQQAPFGPRGMVFVPAAEAARIDDLALPDSAAYDDWFRLRRALVAHDRATAAAAAERLQAANPQGRLTLWAQRQLAYYDDNPARALAAVSALREQFPKEANLQLEELNLLSRLGRRAEHRELLLSLRSGPKTDPAIWREQVELWRADAREHKRAWRLAQRFARTRSGDWSARWTLASVLWDAGDFAAATKLYRLAATGADKAEGAWHSYFAAARHIGRADEVIGLLRSRDARLGSASSQPAITLALALEQLDRTPEARAILTATFERRPTDGDLLLNLAQLTGRTGEPEKAQNYLAAAKPHVTPAGWHRTAARLAAWRADHLGALQHHEAVLAENPLDPGSLAEAARLRALTAGTSETLAWLADCTRRHPHFLPLRQLRLEWLRDRPWEEALAEVKAFLAIEAEHPWALREHAVTLTRARRMEEALASARLAEQIEPGVPASPAAVGQTLLARRDLPAAREAFERALRLDISAAWLMGRLMSACPSFADRVASVGFLRKELARQPSPTTGFLSFRDAAIGVLAPEELWNALETLRAAQRERWEPWSASIQQAVALNRPQVAAALAQEAVEKFPLVPRAWLDLADAHRLANATEAEAAALKRARELSPGWRDAAFRLAELHQRKLQLEDAAQVLQSALAHDPLDVGLRGRLADVWWRLGRHEEALVNIEQAAEGAPGWNEPWNLLSDWARERREPERMLALARRVATNRAGDPQARRRLAQALSDHGDNPAALEEAKAATDLSPRDTDSHDLKAYVLTLLGRRDEALAACSVTFGPGDPSEATHGHEPAGGEPPPLPSQWPYTLQGRAAWVRWQFGERKTAIEAMTAVMAAHPDYGWGWEQLVEWHNAVGEKARAADAAEKIAQLRPHDPTAWGWVASLKLTARDSAAAEPLLERALRLDPGYHYAAFQLLKIACDFARAEQMDQTLALIRQHASRWRALRCEILVHRVRRKKAEAVQALRELCRAPVHETQMLREAADEVIPRWAEEAEVALRDALAAADSNPEAGAVWMRARLQQSTSFRPRVRRLERSGATDAVRRTAWRIYLEWLAHHRKTLTLRWHLWRRGDWFAAQPETWGTLSYVLTNLGWYRRLAQVMRDWRDRKSVEPWMLSNFAHALLARDQLAELAEVTTAALRLPADQTRPLFIALAARAAAFNGHYAEARKWLTNFDNHQKNPFAALIAAQADALASVGLAEPECRREKFASARASLAGAKDNNRGAADVSYMARDERRTLRRMASLARSPWAWWYAIPVHLLRVAAVEMNRRR